MSDSHRPKNDHRPPHGSATRLSEERKKARALGEAAREMRAQAHHAMETNRQLMQHNEEIVQHIQASRERQAELGSFPPPAAPRTTLKILLIEDAPADVELFRYALQECGLCCEVKVLMQGSEVEAFVRQAATASPLFRPQLIIADCMIPGMEAEDILAALRTVPAYQRIPVFLFSTLAEAEGQRRSVQCGATAFVPKPGQLQAFVETVATMVRRWSGGRGGGSDVTLAIPQ
jgi:chemotaxis family two-component system response regulator Rcp1